MRGGERGAGPSGLSEPRESGEEQTSPVRGGVTGTVAYSPRGYKE
jgi:hypothetical protein